MPHVGIRVYDRALSISAEQAAWLAGELRALRPLDVTHAAAAAAERIERALATGSAQADAETTADGVRVLLMALQDLAEAPEPAGPLQALHDALATELVRRSR
ncbi:MAG: hypothetical protein IT201_02640 [Thermoleophilia bacterium]|nr:hypothetical protein [Thermoleophilia bacterium]